MEYRILKSTSSIEYFELQVKIGNVYYYLHKKWIGSIRDSVHSFDYELTINPNAVTNDEDVCHQLAKEYFDYINSAKNFSI